MPDTRAQIRAPSRASAQRRNKGFDETHQDLIATAVRLISEKGVEALSIAELARAMGINRTTVYYHFESREALLAAVQAWSSQQLVKGMDLGSPRFERADFISRFVLENPDLIKVWIEGFVSGRDIRESYPLWDELVQGMQRRFDAEQPGEQVDAEVYCVMMLASAIIGPRVLKNSVCPDADVESIVQRFGREHQRVLRRDGMAG